MLAELQNQTGSMVLQVSKLEILTQAPVAAKYLSWKLFFASKHCRKDCDRFISFLTKGGPILEIQPWNKKRVVQQTLLFYDCAELVSNSV